MALVIDPAGLGTAKQVQDGLRKAGRALEDAGYAVEEVEPPSIELAARTLLDMLYPTEMRAVWEITAPRPVLGKRRDYLLLYMPDYSWIATVCGGFALAWMFVRTGLVLRALRRRSVA